MPKPFSFEISLSRPSPSESRFIQIHGPSSLFDLRHISQQHNAQLRLLRQIQDQLAGLTGLEKPSRHGFFQLADRWSSAEFNDKPEYRQTLFEELSHGLDPDALSCLSDYFAIRQLLARHEQHVSAAHRFKSVHGLADHLNDALDRFIQRKRLFELSEKKAFAKENHAKVFPVPSTSLSEGPAAENKPLLDLERAFQRITPYFSQDTPRFVVDDADSSRLKIALVLGSLSDAQSVHAAENCCHALKSYVASLGFPAQSV